jgi:hypothetical protein
MEDTRFLPEGLESTVETEKNVYYVELAPLRWEGGSLMGSLHLAVQPIFKRIKLFPPAIIAKKEVKRQ